MKRLVSRRKLVVLCVAIVALVTAGLVSAAWLANGSGSGYAKAGTSQALTTLDASASTSATLYPGVTGDVTLRVSNSNPFPVRVTAVSLDGPASGIAPDAGHASCAPTGVTFNDQTGLTIDAPAKVGAVDGTVTATLTGAASMSNASADGCQGATFTIPVNLTGASNAS
jgi:hypothetical protein